MCSSKSNHASLERSRIDFNFAQLTKIVKLNSFRSGESCEEALGNSVEVGREFADA